jgi:tRNA modification GTPase
MDTIFALSSGAPPAAIAVVRISGPAAGTAPERLSGGLPQPRFARLTSLRTADRKLLDQALVLWFPGPASETGEDCAELQLHGGRAVVDAVCAELATFEGLRLAEPGEFTRRAFLNGKLDLTQAEAVMDVISAQTDRALQAAHRQLDGALGRTILGLREELLGIVAHVEAYIDFPEEDIDPDTGAAMRARMQALMGRLEHLLATADQGRLLREGVRTALAGAPNAGKSSLLNRLLGFERAIVSDQPGTTRDTIEEVINLQGFPLRLVDTAGLRDSPGDAIEQAGMARTHHQLSDADLILEVVDASEPPPASRLVLPHDQGRHVRVLHKCDLPMDPAWEGVAGVPVSSRTGTGMDALTARIAAVITEGGSNFEQAEVAVNARHQACLERARSAMAGALGEFSGGASMEFVALDLRLAMEALGDIVGRVDVEDVLGAIFSQFCIGK